MQDDRRERYEQQTTEQYAALGRYVQQFELVCEGLRMAIIWILQLGGLKNQQLARVIVDQRAMTAQPLVDTTCALLFELDPENTELMDLAGHFRQRFLQEIKTRNDYIHGTWFIGWASTNQQDFSEIKAWKGNPSPRTGSSMKRLAKSSKELESRVEALEEIKDGFLAIWTCLLIGRGREIKKDFLLVDGRYVSVDTARRRGWSR